MSLLFFALPCTRTHPCYIESIYRLDMSGQQSNSYGSSVDKRHGKNRIDFPC